MLKLSKGACVSNISRTLCYARSSIGRWINWFTLCGAEGLVYLYSGRERKWPFEQIFRLLVLLVSHLRSHRSSELLATKINEIIN